MVVRTATPPDGPAIAAVQLATWRATYQDWLPEVVAGLDLTRTADNWARAATADGERVAVAEQDGRILGYAHSGPPEEPADTADRELFALYVLPEAQRAGAGRRLVSDAVAAAPPGTWLVWALERHAPARRFYERQGFRVDPLRTRLWRGLAEVRYVAPPGPRRHAT
ncbi:GNAT family N-acetyltransferase [Dactylosporangium sp. NPDC049742]|uniref:GNAT family N-acetyltransferase n=1 Tax=Dactylosporangium sp. NPDC049742 TaxID=3154737 RepID=UPI00341A2B1B